MQQLISIPPSKHAGARVVAAKTTSRNVCLSCILDSQKREMIKTDNLSCGQTGTATCLITQASCGLTEPLCTMKPSVGPVCK